MAMNYSNGHGNFVTNSNTANTTNPTSNNNNNNITTSNTNHVSNGVNHVSNGVTVNGVALPPIATLPLPPSISITNNEATATLPILPVLIAPDNTITNLAAALPIIPTPVTNTTTQNQQNGQQQSTEALNQELLKKDKQIQLIQSAYWQLQQDFDNACNLIKAQAANQANNAQAQLDLNKALLNTSQLNTIEEENAFDIDQYENKIKEQKERIESLEQENDGLIADLEEMRKKHNQRMDDLKKKNRESNKKNNNLEREVKSLKNKVRNLEKQNKKLNNLHFETNNRQKIEKDTLKELYLNSNQIKKFMNSIKKYGEQYQTLKKRQNNLTNCIGKEDNETFKIRMNDLYQDITKAEESYNALYESLDIIKTESQGKEFEAMTRSKEQILRLEQEIQSKSSHLEEYVKKNQSLQLDLTDREMKLRQTQNEVNFVKQKLSRSQNENQSLMDQLNGFYNNMNNQMNMNQNQYMMNNINLNNMQTMQNNNNMNNFNQFNNNNGYNNYNQ